MKLTLFFTEGVSLQTWDTVGMLNREIALYKALQKQGVDVGFVTYGDRGDLGLAPDLPGMDLYVNQSKMPISLYERMLVMQPPKGDVFKSNQVAGAQVALSAARRAKVKFVARCGYLLSEFQENRYGTKSSQAKSAAQLERKVFEGADAVTVTTAAMMDSISYRYKLPREKIGVIPNYVETELFKPAAPHVANQKLRLVFVGRLDKQKNLHALVDAVSGLDIDVWLIGYGPQKTELEEQTKKTRAKFNFLGNVSNKDLPALLNSCDLFVLPSLYEGHPKALLEAMACQLPVIGTNVSGIRELIRDGENGLLCDIHPENIRISVERLLSDSSLRERLGLAGRKFVLQNFALEHIVQLEVALLNRLGSWKI